MNPSKSSLIQELESDPRWLVSLSRRLLGTREGAEDLVQDAAALALTERNNLRSMGPSQARAWLATTVRHLASNARRRRSTERFARRELGSREGTLQGFEPSPADVFAKAEYRSTVAALVLELPEAERQAILLRYYEGKTAREIQAALGVPSEAAVRQLLSRSVARLRERLETYQETHDWRHAALLMTSAVTNTQIPVKVAAVTGALLMLGGTMAGAWWLSTEGTEPEAASEAEAAALHGVPTEPVEVLSAVEPAAATDGRRALDAREFESTVTSGAAPAGFKVRLLDEASGQPLVAQTWFMIATGKLDYGRGQSIGGQEPNPEALASGVTDEEGFASAPLPEYELVNFCIDRTEAHARGSWPIRIRDGVAHPADVTATAGSTIEGRVIDDQGVPLEDIQVYSRTYFDERISLGVTDADGRYSIPRCADFPRSFLLREDGEIEPSRTLLTDLSFAWPGTPVDGAANPIAAGYVEILVGQEPAVAAPDVVLARSVSVSGRVLAEDGSGIEGAIVANSRRGSFAESGDGVKQVPPSASWTQPDFALAEGQCFTEAGGNYTIVVPASNRGRARSWLTAYSPGGDVGYVEINDVTPGASFEGVDFEMRDSGTVRLRLVLPLEVESLDPDIKKTQLIWDLPEGRGEAAPERGTSLTLAFAASPVIETGPDGEYVLIPQAHQPDREARGGVLAGTVFLTGYQPQHFELASGVTEADLPLEPLRSVKLRLALEGEALKWLEHVNVTVTPEAPDPSLSVEDQVRRYGHMTPIRTKVYEWENGAERTLNVFGDRPVYAFVELFGGRARASLPLPPFGPIPLLDADGEDAFVLKATLGPWPERGAKSAEAGGPGMSPALQERRPSVITALVVSDADGAYLVNAKAEVISEGSNGYSYQHLWKGEERYIDLPLSVESATLRFSHPAHYPKEIGPFSTEPGVTTDLGEIRLQPLRRIPCRLEQPDGAPVGPGYLVTRRDPEAGWTQIRADAEGRFDLFVGRAGPTPLTVRHKEGSNDPPCGATVQILPDGSGRVVVPVWRPVRVRVTGLEAPFCYGLNKIRVKRDAGRSGELAVGARFVFPQLDGTDLVFHCWLPPGRWTFEPATPAFAHFPPARLEVEPAPPGSEANAAPLEITIRASLTE